MTSCAVGLVLLKWATKPSSSSPSSPSGGYCYSADKSVDISSWSDRNIPKDAIGAKYITPTKLEELRKSDKIPTLESGVPKIIHQTWPNWKIEESSPEYKQWSSSWGACHPDWLHVLWDDCDIRKLFQIHLPEFLEVFDNYPNPVQRADIFRCLVGKVYGGAYVDMDYECTGGIDGPTGLNPPASSQCKVFVVSSPDPEHDGVLQNAFMASVPQHPYWDEVFKLAVERRTTLNGRIFGEIPIHNTGPGLVSDAYLRLPEGDVKAAVCGLNATEFSGQALGIAPYAVHRNAGSWCACRFPAINFICWNKCRGKMKKYIPSMYRDLTRHKKKVESGEKLSPEDQVTWNLYSHLWQGYYDKYGEFEDA